MHARFDFEFSNFFRNTSLWFPAARNGAHQYPLSPLDYYRTLHWLIVSPCPTLGNTAWLTPLVFFFFFFHLTYSRWTSSLPSCLWSQRIFPSLPGSRLTIFLSRCKFSPLTTRQPMVEFYLLTFPRFPLRKKGHKSYFAKNRTHDFRTTSRCAAFLRDHSGDEYVGSNFEK